MQNNPDLLYKAVVERHHEFDQDATRERLSASPWPKPWRDPAVWAAIIGPIIGIGFLVYFARQIVDALGS